MSDTGDTARFTDHMSDEDALMWNIEKDPILRSTIVAVGTLDRAPDWGRLRETIDRATMLVPRMRQRVQSPPLRIGPPRWAFERDFDLDFHLRRLRVPSPGTHRALLDAVQPIAMSSFDRARPLWEFTVLEGLEGDRAAVVLKIHHSVTDGVGGMELLLHIVDTERDAIRSEDRPAAPAPDALDPVGLVRDSLAHTTRRLAGVGRRLPGALGRAAAGAVRDPGHAASEVAHTARSVVRLLAPANHPFSPLMTARGLGRRLDTLDVPLDDLKRAAKAGEGSLNDAFVAAVVGGLSRYHRHHGADVEHLRMTIPINLRTESDPAAGNRFAPARFPVPISISDPKERMRSLGSLVREWRAEPAIRLAHPLAGALNRLPTTVTTALFGAMLKGSDFTTTNVPGSPFPVYIGGALVERFYAFAPPSGSSMNIALMSHFDQCCIGIVTDTIAVPDTDVLMGCLRDGVDEMVALG